MSYEIYVVEDHPVVRRGLASLTGPEEDLTIVGETDSALQARRDLSERDIDLVILDLSLEEGSGLSLIEDLHATQPSLPVLVVSMHDETLYARRALEAGARGYLMKDRADSKVVEAIRTVLDGSVYISSEVTSAIVSEQVSGASSSDDSVLGVLSDRELEVFTLMGEGKERREIAEALALSPKTVDSHRESLKEKLSLNTNASLRQYAAVWVASVGASSGDMSSGDASSGQQGPQ
jgi:DNA-binding NarL/FixJ family response regulator